MAHANTQQNSLQSLIGSGRPRQPLLNNVSLGIGSTPVPDLERLFEAVLSLMDQSTIPISNSTKAPGQFKLDRQKALRDELSSNFQGPTVDLGQHQALLGIGQTNLGIGNRPLQSVRDSIPGEQNSQGLLGTRGITGDEEAEEFLRNNPLPPSPFSRPRPDEEIDEFDHNFRDLLNLRQELLVPGTDKIIEGIKENGENVSPVGDQSLIDIPGNGFKVGKRHGAENITEILGGLKAPKRKETELEKLIKNLSGPEETKFQRIIRSLAAGSNQLVTGRVPGFLTSPSGDDRRDEIRSQVTSSLIKNAIEQETRPLAKQSREVALQNQILLGNLRVAQEDSIRNPRSDIIDELLKSLINKQNGFGTSRGSTRGKLKPAE